MSISVIVPAYNAGDFVSRAINSALDQTLSPLEVVVVDDASTDDTCAVVERLCAADARVRLVKLSINQGPSGARNAALDAARGDWISVLDADDVYLPLRLEAMMKVAEAHAADIVIDNLAFFDISSQQRLATGVNSIKATMAMHPHEYVSRCQGNRTDVDWGLLQPMFRSTFLRAHHLKYPVNLRHGEDFVLMLDALLQGARLVFTPEVGYLYTERLGTHSHLPSGMSRTRIDYDSMVRHTISLLADRRVRLDPVMTRLLRMRAAALKEIDVCYRMPRYLKERNVRGALKLLVDNRNAWSILGRYAQGKTLSLLGLQ